MNNFIKTLQKKRSQYNYADQARTQAESLKQLSAGIYTEEERFVYELLQNAVDAFVDTKKKNLNIRIEIKDNILCFMHNGAPFSERDIEGLCDVGRSNKASDDKSSNKKKVGYKGIGFKSVFMQSVNYVCVKSGSYCFKFDKDECVKLMPTFPDGKLDADETPWQIVPIPCSAPSAFDTSDYNVSTFIQSNSIKNIGSKIKKLLENPQFLLFLNAKDITINFYLNSKIVISAERKTSNGEVQLICDNNIVSRWLVHTTEPIPVDLKIRKNLKYDFNTPPKLKEATDFEISFAVSINEEGEIQEVEDGVLYTFLPTSYKNLGVPFLVNANFITDAGRQQLHQHSEWNRLIFASIPKYFFEWVAALSLKHDDYYKILPSKTPKSSDELTKIYTDNFQSALDDVAFIPSRENNTLLRVNEAINDCIDFVSVSGVKPFIKHINKEYSKSFTQKSFFDCDDYQRFNEYGVFCFSYDKLKSFFDDSDSIGTIDANQCKDIIDFLVQLTENSDSKDHIMVTLKECKFLLCDDNNVKEPSECYFPTEYSDDSDTSVPLIHSSVFSYIKKKNLFDWFKELDVENLSISNYLRDIYCKHNNNINVDNAIEVGKIVYDAFMKGSLDDIPERFIKRLKFLSTKNELFYADELYISHIYHPQLDLEELIDDDIFVSERYAEYGDINIWKSVFLRLGMSEDVELTKRKYRGKIGDICTIQENHESEIVAVEDTFNNLPIYHFRYGYELEYYPIVLNCSDNRILTILFSKIFKSAYKKEDDSCFLYYRWDVEEHINQRGDFKQRRNIDFSFREFFLKYCQLYPTTTGDALYANEIFMNTELNTTLCGDYLPVLNLTTQLSENWASMLPLKRDLLLDDLLTLLDNISADKEKDNNERISAIYMRIVELGFQNSSEIKKWGKNHKILSANNGQFLLPKDLSYITIDGFKNENKVYLGKVVDSLKEGVLNLLKNFGVKVITKDSIKHKTEGECISNELKDMLKNKIQYIAVLKDDIKDQVSFEKSLTEKSKKVNCSKFYKCNSIQLSYGDENDIIPKLTFSDGNKFYYIGCLSPSKLELLMEPLSKFLGIKGSEKELLIILITKSHDELVEFLNDKGYNTEFLKAPKEDMYEDESRIGAFERGDDSMSKIHMYEALVEAQRALKELRPDWTYPDGYGEYKSNNTIPRYYSTVNIKDELGKKMAIVLKSYKKRDERFHINPEEWRWVVEKEAKLLVYTRVERNLDIVEIPSKNLVSGQSIQLSFSAENLNPKEHAERISKLAATLHYFNRLTFDFEQLYIAPNATRIRDIESQNMQKQDEVSDDDI